MSDIAGERVTLARKRRGWTITRLAQRCAEIGAPQITEVVVGDIERGRRARGPRRRMISLDELAVFAEALSVPFAWFITPLDGRDSLIVTPQREKHSYQAVPFITGDTELPPSNWWSAAPDDEAAQAWAQARGELIGIRYYLIQMAAVWQLLHTPGTAPQTLRVAITSLRQMASTMRDRGLMPPPEAPPEVQDAVTAAIAQAPSG